MNIPSLTTLYDKCIHAKYVHTCDGASYSLQRDGDRLYILLQWSKGIPDWINNFDFATKVYKDMPRKWKAHRGFVRVWKSIEPEVKSDVLDPSIKEIIISGYSHGGAIACLAHEYCWYNRPDIRDNIYGFGFEGPRVFNGKMPEELKERWENFTLIVNGNDLFTNLPPRIFGYKHCGTVLQINPNKTCPDKSFFGPLNCLNLHFEPNVRYSIKKYEERHGLTEEYRAK